MLEYRYKPIVTWPGTLTPNHRREHARFNTPWGKTLLLLEREIRFLRGKNVIFQAALPEHAIRLDGGIKSNARGIAHPGVIITFDSKHGPLSYHTDRYKEFQDNVRAIALALEALRTVDRYGVSKEGQQYTGYKRLPEAGATSNGRVRITTPQAAAEFIASHFSEVTKEQLLSSSWLFDASYKNAAKKLHPDNQDTGDDEAFVDLQDAAAVLKKHHGSAG